MLSKKFALVHLGTDVMYSLEFVAAELLKCNQIIQWFDGDKENEIDSIIAYHPDYVCFSPLTTFFKSTIRIAQQIKKLAPQIKTVFGGPHVSPLAEEIIKKPEVDFIVVGPVYGTIDIILRSNESQIIVGKLQPPKDMSPSVREYFTSIPRIGHRHRKAIMSHFGCLYNCSYCSTSKVRAMYGPENYKKYFLKRRPVKNLIEEAKLFLEFPTSEACLGDDDVLAGSDAEEWLSDFAVSWQKEIRLPLYAFVTPNTVVKVSENTLRSLASIVDTVAMGVQAARPESLKLFNRQFQSEAQIKKAYDRLKSFKISVKLELIVGLPVEDPVQDAIESIKLAQRIGAGSFSAAFPLMLYPGTQLYDWCKKNDISLNEDCDYEWYTGVGSIKFNPIIQQKIRTISKLSTFFIKYNIDEEWIKTLLEININDKLSEAISKSNYLESLIFRQGEEKGQKSFKKALEEGFIRY